jgi:hypothetical protein
MGRRLRCLFTLAAAASAVVCVAVVVLWARSRSTSYFLQARQCTAGGPPWTVRVYQAYTGEGVVGVSYSVMTTTDERGRAVSDQMPLLGWRAAVIDPLAGVRRESVPERVGLHYAAAGAVGPDGPWSQHTVTVPYWLVAGPTAGLAAWCVRRLREGRRRRRRGCCLACGYDLRATPEAGGALLGRCPECGAEAKTPAG